MNRFSLLWLVLLSPLLAVFSPPAGAQTGSEDSIDQQRARFVEAERELRSGAGPRYRSLREQLDNYPLAVYLDYDILRERMRRATPEQANDWLSRAAGTPLANRFREAWLRDHGRRERWRALLAVQSKPPRAARLQCYYYRAKLATGAHEEAMTAAAALWNVGKSQDRACDPLFAEWFTEAGPDDPLVWSRALKAFDARSSQLLPYLTRFASADLVPLIQELYAVYRRPDRLLRANFETSPRHAQLLTVGIRRLARVNPAQGLEALERASQTQSFSDQQIQAMEAMILRHSLFAQSAASDQWVDETLARLRDDELTEIRLRNQIREGDWPEILESLDWLSTENAARDVWQYWRARALTETGSNASADTIWQRLAGERSYHGFLAAERVDAPYQLNEQSPPAPLVPITDAGLARVKELMALGRVDAARAEWQLLLLRQDQSQQRSLAGIALESGWDEMAIIATNTSRSWDDLSSRFPWLYRNEFDRVGAGLDVPAGELVAIARRESALNPRAVSPAGAMGLMQLMPTTARQVARGAGVSYRRASLFQPDYNIDLGARYYGQLKARFDNVRPMALAAYNAGPHRVDRWTAGDLSVEQWVDSLPFRETREYVRAVLTYALIYRLRDGEEARLLTERERKYLY